MSSMDISVVSDMKSGERGARPLPRPRLLRGVEAVVAVEVFIDALVSCAGGVIVNPHA